MIKKNNRNNCKIIINDLIIGGNFKLENFSKFKFELRIIKTIEDLRKITNEEREVIKIENYHLGIKVIQKKIKFLLINSFKFDNFFKLSREIISNNIFVFFFFNIDDLNLSKFDKKNDLESFFVKNIIYYLHEIELLKVQNYCIVINWKNNIDFKKVFWILSHLASVPLIIKNASEDFIEEFSIEKEVNYYWNTNITN